MQNVDALAANVARGLLLERILHDARDLRARVNLGSRRRPQSYIGAQLDEPIHDWPVGHLNSLRMRQVGSEYSRAGARGGAAS